MEDTGITFETAKLAKEKGFDIPTIQYYTIKGYCTESEGYMTERYAESNWNNGMGSYPTRTEEVSCSAPTQSLLSKWLREKYDIEINITRMPPEAIKSSFNKGNKRIKKYNMWVWSLNGNPRIENPSLFFDNYEEAYEIGLQEALKLINNK